MQPARSLGFRTGLETELELSLNLADRRRLTVATLITVAALPALWLMQRDSSSAGSGGVAVAGPSGGIAISGGGEAITSTTAVAATTTASGAMVTLIEPSTDTSIETAPATAASEPVALAPVDTAAPVTAATTPPPAADAQLLDGTATYKRYGGYGIGNPCMAPRAPMNVEITVQSQSSGRAVTCMNVVRYSELADPQTVVVLNTETFLQMADTSDAPVYVEVTW